jgi:hypothetical protein
VRINDQLRPIENGQGDGIRTRIVRVTGGDGFLICGFARAGLITIDVPE